ncbi:HPr kinase/phosphatase C-terminal domain-containing protein [Terrihabitans rhizophilus]|uniref:HPr kinase/phosphatase C-terminal domain-containing protein n=1 Tax=Terrihabitans rhizophilus TaxID=3092662 RepID=A0ABU4RIE2_9HYPH|nr:HPr kinase/phosphatase C-terminal domain-containing protein [Terrihabitans sp. PJ23]MDX6804602.1 HPr kinase/phosphatase C-terminal domain-containing protein [Terrihabitans sp. PJ23]
MSDTSVHASFVSVGGIGVLIRGASGAGKSRLAHILLLRGPLHGYRAALVADDRTFIERREGELFGRAPPELAGLLEIRGLGIARVQHTPEEKIGLIVDLVPVSEVPRLPAASDRSESLWGVTVPRLRTHFVETAFEAILTILKHDHFVLHGYEPLAPREHNGKTGLS